MAAKVLCQYRVSYRFPQQKVVNMNYTAPDLDALMRNLLISEGVDSSTVEFLYIHQLLPDNKTREIMAVESTPKAKHLTIVGSVKKPIVTGEYDDDDDDIFLGWGCPTQDTVISQVTKLLEKSSLPDKVPKRIQGFHFTAKPARSTTTEV